MSLQSLFNRIANRNSPYYDKRGNLKEGYSFEGGPDYVATGTVKTRYYTGAGRDGLKLNTGSKTVYRKSNFEKDNTNSESGVKKDNTNAKDNEAGGQNKSINDTVDVRQGASGAEIAESNAQRDQQFALDRIAAAGNVQANIQRLIDSANMYAADSTATYKMYGADAAKDATLYSADASERTNKYVADVDRAKAKEVATIQGDFSLQLQDIVNAGAKEAEAVRGEYQLANTDLTGQYGLEDTRLAGATSRDVANRNKEATIFGSLMSGFWL